MGHFAPLGCQARRLVVVTDTPGQSIRDIFQGQAVFLTREDGTDSLSCKFGQQLPTYDA